MSGGGVFGSGPTAPHEDLPVDPRAARAAFRSAVRCATVAAMGGFGFRRGIVGSGCGGRGGVGRPDRRPVGPPLDDEALGGIVLRVRSRRWFGNQHLDVHRLPLHRRYWDRLLIGCGSGLHRRNLTPPLPWPALATAAARS